MESGDGNSATFILLPLLAYFVCHFPFTEVAKVQTFGEKDNTIGGRISQTVVEGEAHCGKPTMAAHTFDQEPQLFPRAAVERKRKRKVTEKGKVPKSVLVSVCLKPQGTSFRNKSHQFSWT